MRVCLCAHVFEGSEDGKTSHESGASITNVSLVFSDTDLPVYVASVTLTLQTHSSDFPGNYHGVDDAWSAASDRNDSY